MIQEQDGNKFTDYESLGCGLVVVIGVILLLLFIYFLFLSTTPLDTM